LILEGILTTLNEDGTANIAPMGPIVDEHFSQFVLRPFITSTSYRNLKRSGEGVFHVTDDVELLAQAAVGQPLSAPEMFRIPGVNGMILAGACRWYDLKVASLDDGNERTTIVMQRVSSDSLREFFGFNRAKHAVIEAAILATRLHLTGADIILAEFERLRSPVEKTGGVAEKRAFEFLCDFVKRAQPASSSLPKDGDT
jgi:uncharacterized protein